MYSALSADVDQEHVLEFVENSVKLSKGGFTQTATAIDIVTTALNAYDAKLIFSLRKNRIYSIAKPVRLS